MKKFGKLLLVCLIACLTASMFVGCTKTLEQVNKAMEKKGYSITSTKLPGSTTDATLATKTEDGKTLAVTFLFLEDDESAEKLFDSLSKIIDPLIFDVVGYDKNLVFLGDQTAIEDLKKAM